MSFVPWTEITAFNNIRKYALAYPEILCGQQSVRYRTKVKLHGENAAIRIEKDRSIHAQSRSVDLSPQKDNKGFAAWVHANIDAFGAFAGREIIIYGEWCGKGIQGGTAISELPEKVFAVFAIRSLDEAQADTLVFEPEEIANVLEHKKIPGMHILGWHGEHIVIDWLASDESLTERTAAINADVLAIETNDPWVEETFKIKGTGEGLVYYPVSEEHLGYKNYCNLVFKAKGEKHRVIKTKESAQVNASASEGISQFVEMVVTVPRLEQGAAAVKRNDIVDSPLYEKSNVGKFMNWVLSDVMKECQDELAASGLDWKQVQKAVSDKARNWYLGKAK